MSHQSSGEELEIYVRDVAHEFSPLMTYTFELADSEPREGWVYEFYRVTYTLLGFEEHGYVENSAPAYKGERVCRYVASDLVGQVIADYQRLLAKGAP